MGEFKIGETIEDNSVSIEGLNRAELLAALYNRATCLGWGRLQFEPGDMTMEQAADIIEECTQRGGRFYFDYLKGRVMKIDITGPMMDTGLYNRDNGRGLAEAIVEKLREEAGPRTEAKGPFDL